MSIKYTHFGTDDVVISVKLPDPVNRNNESCIHIILDRSGSMAGAPITNAINGIIALFDFLESVGHAPDQIIFYTFNDKCTSQKFSDYKNAVSQIKTIGAGGSTDFTNVILKLGPVINTSKNLNHCVLFFTDGRDSSNVNATALVDLFKSHVTGEYQIQMHCIGVGDHDSHFLNELIAAGSVAGTYQFCASPVEIKSRIEAISGVLSLKFRKACLTLGTQHFDFVSKDGTYGYLVISEQPIATDMALDIDANTYIMKPEEVMPGIDTIEYYTQYICNEVMKLVRSNLFHPQKLKQIMVLDNTLEKVKMNFGKLPVFGRKTAMESYLACKNFIGEVMSMWRQGVKLNDNNLAMIANKAYSYQLKKGMQRRLNMRAAQNINLEAEIATKLATIVDNIDWENLKKNSIPAEAVDYTCVISCSDVIEAMKVCDVMCLTFNMSRSENAIVNPENLRINNICASKITFGSFCESLVYRLERDETAHGGFDPNAKTSIVVGDGRDEINAIIPMFICPEHWLMAQECMKLVFGWMCTLDILGFDFMQLVTIPFALLSYVKSQPASEFNLAYTKCVEDICYAICKQHPKYFDNVIIKANQYIENGCIRTIDQIGNNQIFLAQLRLLKRMPEFTEKITLDINSERFVFYLLEEELRRWNKYYFGDTMRSPTCDELIDILGLDRKVLVDEPVAAYEKMMRDNYHSKCSGSDVYYRKGCELMKISMFDNRNNNSNSSYNDTIIELDDSIDMTKLALISTLEKFYSPLSKICKTFGFTENIPLSNNQTLQSVAVCLQNLHHCDNSSRREAYEKKTYVDMYTQANCHAYIKKIKMDTISLKKSLVFDEISKNYMQLTSTNVAKAFCMATDIPTAIGALYGASRYTKEFMYIFNTFCSQQYPLAQYKLNMLLTGQYRGIQLVNDHWFPSKRNNNKIYNTYWRSNIKAYIMHEDQIDNMTNDNK